MGIYGVIKESNEVIHMEFSPVISRFTGKIKVLSTSYPQVV